VLVGERDSIHRAGAYLIEVHARCHTR
jgi:hypothetical protein